MSSSSQVAESWISSFCNLLGHEYFAEVSEDFIEDDFNLTGLSSQVSMYKEALEMILDVEPEEDEETEEEEEDDDEDDDLGEEGRSGGYGRTSADRRHMRLNHDLNVIESSAELLYGLIHQRYITSRQGMGQMQEKYERGHFGACPRVFCGGAKVVPVGCSDTPGQDTVKLFCPSCFDVYTPPNSRFHSVDGAFFGTTFPCLFFMTFPDLQISTPQQTQLNHQNLPLDTTSPLSPRSDMGSPVSTPNAFGTSNSRNTFISSSPPPPDVNGVASANFAPGLGPAHIYEHRIYGFRVSERAKTGPRMKWLRMKPNDLRQLDEARIYHDKRTGRLGKLGGDDEDDAPEMDLDDDDNRAEHEEQDAPDQDMVDEAEQHGGHQEARGVERRKKAPMRRRRRIGSAGSTGGFAAGVNGVG